MKNTKIKHHLMKQVVSREELLQLGWGVKLYFSKSLGNSKMTPLRVSLMTTIEG